MPLPPALLARLKKRGIVKEKEEVIAESYDSAKDSEEKRDEMPSSGAPGCPNKYNPYHFCTEYCFDFWGDGTPETRMTESYHRRRMRMLSKYPLPDGWTEVYDAGIARHYYWCPETDEVSWLSPRHPHAVIGEAAPKISKEMFKDREPFIPTLPQDFDENRKKKSVRWDDRAERADRQDDRRDRDPRRVQADDPDSDEEREKRRRRMEGVEDEDNTKRPEISDRDRLKRAKRKGLDPMDPAAYSDIAAGKWSSGLFADDKSGVDTTAGGPLFQMRPYPAPGAILRAQKGKED